MIHDNYFPIISGHITHESISDVSFFELYFGLNLSNLCQEGDKVHCSTATNFSPKAAMKYTMKNFFFSFFLLVFVYILFYFIDITSLFFFIINLFFIGV